MRFKVDQADDTFVRELILEAIRGGLDFCRACELHGVVPATARNWRVSVPSFDRDVMKADATCEKLYTSVVLADGLQSVDTAKWILERRYPARWGRSLTTRTDAELERLRADAEAGGNDAEAEV